jgi:hypothetical protein
MKKRTILLVAMSLFMFIACKKDSKKDCDVNNYGTVTINFLHTSDTLHYGPGSFTLQILNHSTSNSTVQSVDIQTCKEVVVNTSI